MGDTLQQHPLGWSIPPRLKIGDQQQRHVPLPEPNGEAGSRSVPCVQDNLLDQRELLGLEMG
jgi:hypothetical protein